MNETVFTVRENTLLIPGVYGLTLEGDTASFLCPGQFAELAVRGTFLRRPLSVCEKRDGELRLIYRVVGKGTEALSLYARGERISLLCGLGHGFNLSRSGRTPVLVGGGLGAPPLLWLCRELVARGCAPRVILGFGRACDVMLEADFAALCPVQVTTLDGSAGIRGTALDALEMLEREEAASAVYSCGPLGMLRALDGYTARRGVYCELSLEERMGCGFGVCMGCSVSTVHGMKRVCREGPVFAGGEVIWETGK